MRARKQNSTAIHIPLFMADSVDGKTGKTGLTVTVQLSKNCAGWANAAGVVTEIGYGWYCFAANATDRNTLGALIIRATAAGAETYQTEYTITAFDSFEGNALGLAYLDRAVSAGKLAGDGLDAIIIPEPADNADSRATFPKMFGTLFRRFFNKMTATAAGQALYKDNDTSTLLTWSTSDDGTTVTKGKSA